MTTTVNIPQFEMVGPPCEAPGCGGVLWNYVNLKTRMFFRKCCTCGGEFHQATLEETLAWSIRTINRVLEGTEID